MTLRHYTNVVIIIILKQVHKNLNFRVRRNTVIKFAPLDKKLAEKKLNYTNHHGHEDQTT